MVETGDGEGSIEPWGVAFTLQGLRRPAVVGRIPAVSAEYGHPRKEEAKRGPYKFQARLTNKAQVLPVHHCRHV